MAVCTHLDQITVDPPDQIAGWSYCYIDEVIFVVDART